MTTKRMRPKVVLHPVRMTGEAEALHRLDGLELIDASSDDEVEAALDHGAPIMVTCVWRDRFLKPGLKWIQGIGAGYEQFPLAELDRHGIVLTTATGVHVCVAESAFGLLLALTRRIAHAVRDAHNRQWEAKEFANGPDERVVGEGVEVAGSTLAIIGLGTIGEQVARRASGWDVDVIGYKREPERYDGIVRRVFGPGQLLEVCRMADILVLTLPGSDETHHLIGAPELEALGAGWLINVGRGSVVDELALIGALTNGELLGAGLDVFEREPLPEGSPLWDMSNVVITPHIAGTTPHYGERLATIFQHNLRAFLGEDVRWMNQVAGGKREEGT